MRCIIVTDVGPEKISAFNCCVPNVCCEALRVDGILLPKANMHLNEEALKTNSNLLQDLKLNDLNITY